MFQRTAQWMFPNPNYHEKVGPGVQWALRHLPFYGRWYRFLLFWPGCDGGLAAARVDPEWPHQDRAVSATNDITREIFTAWITEQVGDDPELLAKVIPDYPATGKRTLQDNGSWLRALKRDNVELVREGIDHIDEHGVVTASGARYDVDIIVYATGFQANKFLWPMDIVGRDGAVLAEQWGDEPSAYLGITVPELPEPVLHVRTRHEPRARRQPDLPLRVPDPLHHRLHQGARRGRAPVDGAAPRRARRLLRAHATRARGARVVAPVDQAFVVQERGGPDPRAEPVAPRRLLDLDDVARTSTTSSSAERYGPAMPIALTDTHRELERVARAFLENVNARAAARALLDAPTEELPKFWDELAELGWLGLHLPEAVGGSGYGLPELVIVLQELGRAVAPGPFLPTVMASTVIAMTGSDAQRAALLPGLADGSRIAALGLGGALALDGQTVNGEGGAVLGAGLAELFVLVAGDDVVVVDRDTVGLRVTVAGNLDPTRRVGTVEARGVTVPPDRVLRGAAAVARDVARALVSAEAAGGAQECVERATAYAKERQQFGRPIAMFQAVKHHCANMLVASELATAAVWDAARAAEGGGDQFAARGRGRRGASGTRIPPQLAAQHPGARRHRLHMGARRAHAAAARARPWSRCSTPMPRPGTSPRSGSRGRPASSGSTFRPKPRRSASRRARSPRSWPRSPRPSSARS